MLINTTCVCVGGGGGEGVTYCLHQLILHVCLGRGQTLIFTVCLCVGRGDSGSALTQTDWQASEASETLFSHVYGNSREIYIYVTVPGKRAHVAQIMIFLYRRF